MWKVFLDSINQNQGGTDQVGVNIKFTNSVTGQELTKSYQLSAGNFKSLADVKGLVTDDLDKLNKFDSVVDLIKSYVGKEIK